MKLWIFQVLYEIWNPYFNTSLWRVARSLHSSRTGLVIVPQWLVAMPVPQILEKKTEERTMILTILRGIFQKHLDDISGNTALKRWSIFSHTSPLTFSATPSVEDGAGPYGDGGEICSASGSQLVGTKSTHLHCATSVSKPTKGP